MDRLVILEERSSVPGDQRLKNQLQMFLLVMSESSGTYLSSNDSFIPMMHYCFL